MKKIAILLLILMASTAHSQIRQRSNTQGLNIALQGHYLDWDSDYFQNLADEVDGGYGGGIRLSYGITQLLEPYVQLDITGMDISDIEDAMNSFTMTHVDAGLRLNLGGTTRPFRPFVEGGYSFRKAKAKDVVFGLDKFDSEFKGGSYHVGGGIGFFLQPNLSIFIRAIYTGEADTELKTDGIEITNEADLSTFRFALGINLNLSEFIQK